MAASISVRLREDEKEVIQKALEDTRAKISANYRKNNQIATGRTDRETYTFQKSANRWAISLPFWVRYLETGRPAGGVPPINKIKEWVQAKGIEFTDGSGRVMDIDRTAAAIAFSIQRSGTKMWKNRERKEVYTKEIENMNKFLTFELRSRYTKAMERAIVEFKKSFK